MSGIKLTKTEKVQLAAIEEEASKWGVTCSVVGGKKHRAVMMHGPRGWAKKPLLSSPRSDDTAVSNMQRQNAARAGRVIGIPNAKLG